MSSTQLPSDLITSFASADSTQRRELLLHSQQLLHNPHAVQALCDQASQWAREDPPLARKAADSALWLAKALGHAPSEGLAHRTLANVFASLARPSEAFAEYTAALDIFATLDDSQQAAITRSSALPIVSDTLGTDTAFKWAEVAREAFQEAGDELRLARLENNLAVLRFRQEDFPRALRHWQIANATLQRIGETSDQAATLRNLAVCSISLNQPSEAKAYYKKARDLCESHNFTYLIHTIDYNIAYLHYLEGDHHRALQLYQAARTRSREVGDIYHEAYCSLDETEVYIELNLLREADTVAQLAATQFRAQERPYEAAKAMFNLALVRARQGDPRGALDHLNSASETFAGQGNILWPGQVELLRATVFFSEGRFFEARRSASLALSRFQQSGLTRRASLAQLLLAKICHSQGTLVEAERHCRAAVDTLQGFGEPDSLFQAFFLLGRILETQGDSTGAMEAFRRAESFLLELRQRPTASQMRVSVVDQPLDVYVHLVSLLLSEESVAPLSGEMFRLIETAKARSFADLMALSGVHTPASTAMRSQLVDQVSSLRQELNWLYRRIDRSDLPDKVTKPSAVESLQRQSQAKEQELARTLSLLRVRDPNAEADPERIGITDIEAVQQQLREHVLLEFYIAHDVVVALVLSSTHRKVLPVAVMSTVRDLQRRLWHYLHYAQSTAHSAKTPAAPASTILNRLYSELLLPLEDFLSDSPLLIAPHGFLFLLPFHALCNEDGHLVERAPVSYVPSAAVLSRVVSSAPLELQTVGVVGDSGSSKLANVFPPVSNSVPEAGLPAVTDQRSARETDSKDWSATHLVAKARLRSDNPLFSAMEFGTEELTFLDLYRSKMFGPVLTVEGEGFAPASPSSDREISALWGALLTSGARCALVPTGFSPPSIHREHARLLYRELFSGTEAAEAHRQAMLTMLHRKAELHEWAGLFLIGDPFLSLKRSPGKRVLPSRDL